MIYPLRGHIRKVPRKITSLFFTWARFQNCGVKHVFCRCFIVGASVLEPEIDKANCSVVFKM